MGQSLVRLLLFHLLYILSMLRGLCTVVLCTFVFKKSCSEPLNVDYVLQAYCIQHTVFINFIVMYRWHWCKCSISKMLTVKAFVCTNDTRWPSWIVVFGRGRIVWHLNGDSVYNGRNVVLFIWKRDTGMILILI